MADFWGGFSAGFNPAYQQSADRYQRAQIAQQELDLRKAADARAAEAHDLQMKGARRVDDATEQLNRAFNQGIQTAPGTPMADLETASMAAGQGLQMPDIERKAASYRPANERELANLEYGLAAARGDMGGLGNRRQELKALDRKDRQKTFMQEFDKLPDDQLVQHPRLRALLNDNMKAKGSVGYDPKTKLYVVTDYNGSGDVQFLTRSEVMDAAMQRFDESEGDFDQATTRGLARDARRRGVLRENIGDQNKGLEGAHRMNVDDARLGLDRARLGLEKDRADREKYQILAPTSGYEVGPDGKLVPVMRGLRLGTKAGSYDPVSVPMPGGNGFIPQNAFDPAKMYKAAEGMVGQPTGRVDPKTGKPEVYTAETAMGAVRQQIINNYAPTKQATGIPPDAAEKARQALRSQGQGAPAPVAATDQQRTTNPAERISHLQQLLARDDRIKAGGVSGLGLRAVQEGAFPLGMAERSDMERELSSLTGR